jgi:hypothetical protein
MVGKVHLTFEITDQKLPDTCINSNAAVKSLQVMRNIFLSSNEHNDGQGPQRNINVLTAKQFLDVDNGGVVSAKEFLATGERMRMEDYQYLKRGIENIKNQNKVIHTTNSKLDRGNQPYKFYTFLQSSKATDGIKLLSLPFIEDMMEQYKAGALQIDFTLEELIAEARKA